MFRALNRDSDNTILFRSIKLLMKTADKCLIRPNVCLENVLKKITSENRPFLGFFEPFTNVFTASLFGKTEYFSFFIDKILQKSRITILKLGKDSPESGEHSRYPESMSGHLAKIF